ncbi:hypothetical protein JMG10_05205 [Nostoc ellipsosporum NOK]|jgi:hypothetical protein|nr:hypothetical protein [Nostoc ellipsosporum NOK]
MNSIFDVPDKPIDERLRGSMRAMAKIAGTAAIVMAINATLSVISNLVEFGRQSNIRSTYEGFGGSTRTTTEGMGGVMIFQVLFAVAIWTALTYFLMSFSRKTVTGLDANDQQRITEGLGNLASYFKIIGVLLCIITGLLVLVLLGALATQGA